jgi:hypothetical protein
MRNSGLLFILWIVLQFLNNQVQAKAQAPDLMILKSSYHFKISSSSQAESEENYKMLIKNKEGLMKSQLVFYYDRFKKIQSISIVVKELNGQSSKKIHLSDFADYSAFNEDGLYTDDRMKYYDFTEFSFPFIVEVSIIQKYNGFLHVPSFYAVSEYGVSSQNINCTIEYPKDYNLKWMQFGEGIQHKTDSNNFKCFLRFHLDSFLNISKENFAPDFKDLVPHVEFNLPYFKYDKSEGDLSSWTSYGTWLSSLLESLNTNLSEDTKTEMLRIKSLQLSKKEKAELVYKWFQKKTRYISVQIGIGGYKPSSPNLVDAFGYGDCKALVYYYITLLKYADIDAFYCVTKSSNEGENIPSLNNPNFTYFNHVIAAIPLQNDTIFVECTNHKIPFGFIPSSWSGKPFLLVNGNQSNLSKISIEGDNEIQFKMVYHVSKNLNMRISKQTTSFGNQLRSKIWEVLEPKEDLIKELSLYYLSNNKKLENFDSELETNYQFIKSKTDLTCGIKPKSDGRIILNLLEDKWMSFLDWDTSRLYEGVFNTSYQFTDTILFQFDTLIKDVVLPSNFNQSNMLFTYSVNIVSQQDKVWVYRKFQLNPAKLSLAEMKDLAVKKEEFIKYESSKFAFRF